jgi:hypothetical protein
VEADLKTGTLVELLQEFSAGSTGCKLSILPPRFSKNPRGVFFVGGIRVCYYLNAQVFATSFAERPKHIEVVPLPVFRIAEISVGEVVDFDDVLHDLLCLCDDVTRGAEPQLPNKGVKPDKF